MGHAADQDIQPGGGGHADADAELRRGSAPRRPMAHSRRSVRVSVSGHDQVSAGEGESGGRATSSGHRALLSTLVALLADANRRHGPLLQAGQDKQGRLQEGHFEHRASSFSRQSVSSRLSARTVPQPRSEISKPFWRIYAWDVTAHECSERGSRELQATASRHAERVDTVAAGCSRTATSGDDMKRVSGHGEVLSFFPARSIAGCLYDCDAVGGVVSAPRWAAP